MNLFPFLIGWPDSEQEEDSDLQDRQGLYIPKAASYCDGHRQGYKKALQEEHHEGEKKAPEDAQERSLFR